MAPPGGPSCTGAGPPEPCASERPSSPMPHTLRSPADPPEVESGKEADGWVVVLHASSPSERLSEHSVAGSERGRVGLGEAVASVHSKGFT